MSTQMSDPYLSVVIPVYNEEANLPELFKRLTAVLDKLGRSYEIIFSNDGSKDNSFALMESFYQMRPDILRIVDLNGNYGQHMAIMAGLERVRGQVVMTMDADLQNPPEELPKVLCKIDEGFDYVGSYRLDRQDSFFRTYASKLVNWILAKGTSIHLKEHGCMLRAYSRDIIDAVTQSHETSTVVPVLAYKYASNPTEVGIAHAARVGDDSKYNLYKLIRLNFDLFTGFSLLPLHVFTLFGMLVSALSSVLVTYMLVRRLLIGPEAEGLFTLFAILFFLVSVAITGIGIVGEYVGRIYELVKGRPRYLVKRVIEQKSDIPAKKAK